MATPQPNQRASGRDYKAALWRILKASAAVVRHTAAAIGWLSRIWFNFTLPLAILLAGVAIALGLGLLAASILAPDNITTTYEFIQWLRLDQHR